MAEGFTPVDNDRALVHSRLVTALLPCFRKRVLMLGDSFINHLYLHARKEPLGESFGLEDAVNIRWFGLPGATVYRLRKSVGLMQCVANFKPQTIILQIGSNDLCSAQTPSDAWQVGLQVCTLAEDLLRLEGIEFVLVLGPLPRARPSKYSPNIRLYSSRSAELNHYLSVTVDGPGLKYFSFPRIANQISELTGNDGVHLSQEGLRRYYRDMKYAVLHAVKSVRRK